VGCRAGVFFSWERDWDCWLWLPPEGMLVDIWPSALRGGNDFVGIDAVGKEEIGGDASLGFDEVGSEDDPG